MCPHIIVDNPISLCVATTEDCINEIVNDTLVELENAHLPIPLWYRES